MSEIPIDTSEKTSALRPREEIRRDEQSVERQLALQDEETRPLREKFQSFPDEQRAMINAFCEKLESGGNPDEGDQESFSPELYQTAKAMYEFSGRFQILYEEMENLHSEELPYVRADFENMLESLLSRVNYNAVFVYYKDVGNGVKQRVGEADLFVNTATEFYRLRKYACDHSSGADHGKDYYYFSDAQSSLALFEKEWARKGFLSEGQKDIPSQDESPLFSGENESRKQITETLRETLESLDEYGVLSRTYKPSLPSHEHTDHFLETIRNVLASENGLYYSEGLENVGFDPKFLSSARRFADSTIDNHRRAGRLPKTVQITDEERQRVDTIEYLSTLSKLNFSGFDPPEEMVAVITPAEIISAIEKVTPPDFLRHLQSISNKTEPEKSPDDDPNTETLGTFIPILGTDENWGKLQGTGIEIYRNIFIAEETPSETKVVTRFMYMSTLFHEFGHNAHYSLDYDEMVQWEKVIEEDKTAITWNVKNAKKKQEQKGKREDFADSFSHFLTNPTLLLVLSPVRYNYMGNYFIKHLQTWQRENLRTHLANDMQITLEAWKSLGYTSDDIRRIYLTDEAEKP